MDPISLIVAALVAGAAAGARDVAARGVGDAYGSLKRLVLRRLKDHGGDTGVPPEQVLEAHSEDPATREAPMAKALAAATADQDAEILSAARALLEAADPDGAAAGKYTVDARGAQGVQVGDHATMQIHVTERPRRGR